MAGYPLQVKADAILVKTEPTYSGSVVFNPVFDAIQTAERIQFSLSDYAYDGKHKGQASDGPIIPNQPTALSAKATIVVELKGNGVGYNTSSAPPNINVLLLAAGYSASYTTGSARVYLSVNPDTQNTIPNSFAAQIYSAGKIWGLAGGHTNFSMESQKGEPPILSFACQALVGIPSASTKPASLLPGGGAYASASVLWPAAKNIGLTINGVSGITIRGWKLDLQRKLDARLDQNSSGGHGGFALGMYDPTLELTIEELPLATINIDSFYANATQVPISFTINGGVGNTFTFIAAQAVVSKLDRAAEQTNVATQKIVFTLPQSTPNSYDTHKLIFS